MLQGRPDARKRVDAVEIRLTPADEPATPVSSASSTSATSWSAASPGYRAEQRAVVVLVYYLDLPLADAAQAMGIPLGTTKSRLNRATQALRAAIEADDRKPSRVREQIA